MKKLMGILGFLVALNASAAQWQLDIRPTYLTAESESDGSRNYLVTDKVLNPDNCSTSSAHYRIRGNSLKGKYITSISLSALLAGKKINLLLTGCDDWGRPIVEGIQIAQ